MITIDYLSNIDDNNDFRSEYVHMKEIYKSYSGTYYDLQVYHNNILVSDDTRSFKYDSFTEKSYLSYNHCYINSKMAFDSLLDLAKVAINNSDDNSIRERLENIDDLNKDRCDPQRRITSSFNNLVNNWVQNNFYPYNNFDKSDFPFAFLYDCIRFYGIYNIHIWLIKIINNIDTIVEKPNNRRELANLNKALKFINFNSIIYNIYLNGLILNLPENYSPLEDLSTISSFCLENIPKSTEIAKKKYDAVLKRNKDKLIIYCEVIRRNLIGYVVSIIKSNPSDFHISKQPFYEPNGNQYRIIETANSLIGIVYNKLLFYLTANKIAFDRVICKNSNCTNEIIKIGKQEWCENYECQKARNRQKNYNRYHSEKEQKKRQLKKQEKKEST